MALINCPECQNKISNKALACPKCGFGVREYFVSHDHEALKAIDVDCIQCGNKMSMTDLFCYECGSSNAHHPVKPNISSNSYHGSQSERTAKYDIFDDVFEAKNIGEFSEGYVKLLCWFAIASVIFIFVFSLIAILFN